MIHRFFYSVSTFLALGLGSYGLGQSPSMFDCALHRVPSTLLHIGVGVPTPLNSPPAMTQYASASLS